MCIEILLCQLKQNNRLDSEIDWPRFTLMVEARISKQEPCPNMKDKKNEAAKWQPRFKNVLDRN